MFINIIAEMARYRITKAEMAEKLGMDRNTLSKKLKGISRFHSDHIIKIKKEFFPDCDFEYLIYESDKIRRS